MEKTLRSRHITRFGYPLSPSGALYCVNDLDGLVQMDVDLELVRLKAMGASITNKIRSNVKDKVKKRVMEYHEKVFRLGIPESINRLLSINSKNKVERYVREITLSENELFLFIHNCTQLGFSHRSRFKQYIPEHLSVSSKDLKDLHKGEPKKFLKKVTPWTSERKYIHVHLFENGSDWHCLYFSHQDIEDRETNHWKNGCHIHYVSHLWPNLQKKRVWNQFSKRHTEISNRLHIKFAPFIYPNQEEIKEDSKEDEDKITPTGIVFNTELAEYSSIEQMPIAHVETRGMWFAKVSIPYNRK